METGTGALSPDLYYSVLHNKYKKSAAAKNKLSFRTLAGINLYNQVDEAEAIDSALVKRAKVEALNVADRQVDIAWLAEGDKVSGQMERFRRNIDRILLFCSMRWKRPIRMSLTYCYRYWMMDVLPIHRDVR